jgi:hypothetical protein
MKRKTKEQGEAAAKVALRQRVEDMAVAAEGGAQPATNDWWATADCLSRWVPALRGAIWTGRKG